MASTKPIVWDALGERLYETGVDHVVYYPYENGKYENGVAWNGVTAITENKSGAEPTALYADNIKYLVLKSIEEFGLTIECYTYPKEFEEANGMKELVKGATVGQQNRKSFGLCYRTLVGSDTEGNDKGYKLHLVYGCDASPSEEANNTINESPEAKTFSFEVSTIPVAVPDLENTSCIVISSNDADPTALGKLEKELFGSEEKAARLPLPEEVKTLLTQAAAG